MKTMKMVLNWCIPIVLTAVALMPPAIAETRHTIKIWPDQLKPMEPMASIYRQDIGGVFSGEFYASINLPVGARITKITYYHWGNGSPETQIEILRTKMESWPELLWSAGSTDSTQQVIPVDVSITGDSIIRAGYRYFLRIDSSNSSSHIKGVKITYQE